MSRFCVPLAITIHNIALVRQGMRLVSGRSVFERLRHVPQQASARPTRVHFSRCETPCCHLASLTRSSQTVNRNGPKLDTEPTAGCVSFRQRHEARMYYTVRTDSSTDPHLPNPHTRLTRIFSLRHPFRSSNLALPPRFDATPMHPVHICISPLKPASPASAITLSSTRLSGSPFPTRVWFPSCHFGDIVEDRQQQGVSSGVSRGK